MDRNYRAHLQTAAYLALGVAAVLVGWAGPTDLPWWQWLPGDPQPWWHVVTLGAMGAAMLLKVQRPTFALLLGGLCVLMDLSFGFSVGILICLTDLIYNHGIRAPADRAKASERLLGGVVLLLAGGAVLIDSLFTAVNVGLLALAVLMVPAWWAGEVRRGYPSFVEDRIRQRLEQEQHAEVVAQQERRRRSAVDRERRRMARELHDVVSSHVASIALTSGAVLNAEPDAERDRRALRTIRETSLSAMDELRQMVQVLRGQGQDDDDATGLLTETTWDQVLQRARNGGLDVDVHGHPPADLTPTERGVVLRILQEALTNAHRHGANTAEVRLRATPRKLELTVDSPPREDAEEPTVTGSGTGIIAMQERARSLNGTVTARAHQGLWRVQAEIPLARTSQTPQKDSE
ncbi:sensor histidine kinase [Nesterenkonia alba]|uniref:sensor histidine kinase n=1 Tax=Nesterenkonia alba TaxID=515814 RepID=UPI0003B35900|nr:histidine kinase [Nesterenkonia alba]